MSRGRKSRERERERERENLNQAPCSVWSPIWGSIPPPWDHDPWLKSRVECSTNWVTQLPLKRIYWQHKIWHNHCFVIVLYFSFYGMFFTTNLTAASFLKSLFIYFERERERAGGRQTQRGRERIPSRLHVVRAKPDIGLHPTNTEIVTWAETKSQTLKRLSHPGAPWLLLLNKQGCVFYICPFTSRSWYDPI